jgi:hypothetical protein
MLFCHLGAPRVVADASVARSATAAYAGATEAWSGVAVLPVS